MCRFIQLITHSSLHRSTRCIVSHWAQVHWSNAMLSGVGTIDSHTLPDQVTFTLHILYLMLHVTMQFPHVTFQPRCVTRLASQDVMLVRRKGCSMSAPSTPYPSLPPTPLRVFASPRIGVPGLAPGTVGSAFSGVGDAAALGAASCLVAKLTASATITAAAPAGPDSNAMSTQIFNVARLLRYKVFLLQQVR